MWDRTHLVKDIHVVDVLRCELLLHLLLERTDVCLLRRGGLARLDLVGRANLAVST